MSTFAQRFKQLRENVNMTQDQAAELLGVSRSTIAGYESEDKARIPRKETLQKISKAFNVSMDYLFGESEEQHVNSANIGADSMDDLSNDPEINVFFKDFKNAPKERQEEMLRFWEFIKQNEKNRKPGDIQGE
ncbi:helix-turn-helix domain-containing protein [Paenibacillus sp. N1-5-1-14]|uniref:helix-turn-helix domain-containing protein n=1 Tax=Paenibacillus radicibacter TaxID=2972488 RepID=UPI002159624B|nr:helix-turn-helix transcriptional regulator [Paenibacillus radicibacter]MCR8645559.1 helix-turn-helix domain-containing protein [Paenibacillus radicibacter]